MELNKVLTKAIEMDEYKQELPKVEINDETTLETIWDGNGNVPEDSYSYQLTDNDWINYCFEIVEENENPLKTIIKIKGIELV